MQNVRCLVPAVYRCGEGAVWSALESAVYWVDINRFLLHRFDLAGNRLAGSLFALQVDVPGMAENTFRVL